MRVACRQHHPAQSLRVRMARDTIHQLLGQAAAAMCFEHARDRC
jgi:hypothetical protein